MMTLNWIAVATILLLPVTVQAQVQEWIVSAEPSLAIGRVDGEEPYLFSHIASAVRLATGQIVVGSSGSSDLRWFSPNGEHLRTVGRQGRGPGEFSLLVGLIRGRGDTLIAIDRLQFRATHFDSAGSLVRSVQMPVLAVPEALFSDGSYLVVNEHGPTGTSGVLNYEAEFLRVAADGSGADTIATAAGGQGYWLRGERGGMSQIALPFRRYLSRAILGDIVFYGNGAEYVIASVNGSGESGPKLTRAASPRELSQADRERVLELRLESITDDNRRREARQQFEEIPMPERAPYYSRILTDDSGLLWVERYPMPWDQTSDWDVFDRERQLIAHVRSPAGVRITEVGSSYVLGVHVDQLGVERVQLFTLDRE